MEKKDQYVRKLHATIDEWSARLDRAEARAKAFEADVRERYQHALQTLNARLAELQSRARELEQAREDTWGAIKKSVEVGIEEFKREYRSAREERDLKELEALPAAEDPAAPGGEAEG